MSIVICRLLVGNMKNEQNVRRIRCASACLLICLDCDIKTTVYPVALDARKPVSALASAVIHLLSSRRLFPKDLMLRATAISAPSCNSILSTTTRETTYSLYYAQLSNLLRSRNELSLRGGVYHPVFGLRPRRTCVDEYNRRRALSASQVSAPPKGVPRLCIRYLTRQPLCICCRCPSQLDDLRIAINPLCNEFTSDA